MMRVNIYYCLLLCMHETAELPRATSYQAGPGQPSRLATTGKHYIEIAWGVLDIL